MTQAVRWFILTMLLGSLPFIAVMADKLDYVGWTSIPFGLVAGAALSFWFVSDDKAGTTDG